MEEVSRAQFQERGVNQSNSSQICGLSRMEEWRQVLVATQVAGNLSANT